MKQQLEWRVGHTHCKDMKPGKFVKANVPGAVQLDWAQSAGIPDYRFDENFKLFYWMEDKFWLYQATIDFEMKEGEKIFFISKGIDYEFEIRLNGKSCFYQEGMFRQVELDITNETRQGSVLEVLIYPVPKRHGAHKDTREEVDQCCKPAVSYGWDWHPRLIPIGIWQDTYIEVRDKNYFREPNVSYRLKQDYSAAVVELNAESMKDCKIEWKIFDSKGKEVGFAQGSNSEISIKNPRLWWCNGYGEPHLYVWQANCIKHGRTISYYEGKIGFRTVSLEMNEGAWDEPKDFPKTRSVPAVTICLNGKKVFAKGTNWVNPEIFPGTITRETYKPLIELAHEANFNIFRSWGGAIVNKDSFFELCDEYGILVWQEFPLACGNYKGTDKYLRVLESEATAILYRLKKHPCIALWCGGNELFNNWSGMTDQDLALRLLNKLCYEEDRGTPFIMTSPLMGMGHGCYMFKYPNGDEVYKVMNEAHFTAYTEFGVPSIGNKECLLAAVPKDKLFPLTENSSTIAHHAFRAWDGWQTEDTWSSLHILESYFGQIDSLDELIHKSQWMQAEGYKCLFEEARRQKPYCSMVINWCYNEPWPTLANNSIISYPHKPKMSYYAIKQSCREVLASARLKKFSYKGGEIFEAELWMLNDSIASLSNGTVKAYIILGVHKLFILEWKYDVIPASENLMGPIIRYQLPDVEAEKLKLILEAKDYSSEYELVYSQTSKERSVQGLKKLNG